MENKLEMPFNFDKTAVQQGNLKPFMSHGSAKFGRSRSTIARLYTSVQAT